MKKKKRDYKKEYNDFHAKTSQKKNRASRNAARAKLKKKGIVKKSDGMDVHHKDHNPQNNATSNLKVVKIKINRSDNQKPGKKTIKKVKKSKKNT